MNICIVGGGNLATVCAGFFAAQNHTEVRILTRKPTEWSRCPEVTDPEGHCFTGQLQDVSSNASAVIPSADIVLLCLPGFAIEERLTAIRPHLRPDTAVGSIVSSTGFWVFAHQLLPAEQPLFGFQRVPFIARTVTYGHRAQLLGYKPVLHTAFEHTTDTFADTLSTLFRTPVTTLNSYLEASLTNSNPLLHTARLFDLFHDWDGTPLPHSILFYEQWTLSASQLLLSMDQEFMSLTAHLGISEEAIPSLLRYYESTDAASLTRKLQQIEAFRGIAAPLITVPGGYAPDFHSRYFTEDFPFGLRFVRDLLHQHHLPCPHIDRVFAWGMKKDK